MKILNIYGVLFLNSNIPHLANSNQLSTCQSTNANFILFAECLKRQLLCQTSPCCKHLKGLSIDLWNSLSNNFHGSCIAVEYLLFFQQKIIISLSTYYFLEKYQFERYYRILIWLPSSLTFAFYTRNKLFCCFYSRSYELNHILLNPH